MRSRLKTNIKKQNKKTLIGIILILILIIFFGMKFLVGFSIFLEKFKNTKDNTTDTQSIEYIAPPVINPIPSATNKPKLTITGSSTSNDVSIKLYVNGELVDKTKPSNNSFVFNDVSLTSGDNDIKALAENKDNKRSDYSQSAIIKYINKQPTLEITSPGDGQTFKKDESPIKISGKTDSGSKVTVNDFWAIQSDNGDFYYLYPLKDGDNTLKVEATDDAGNKTSKELKIKTE